ncbi:hypothetical protein LXL04_031145 [Taraxacum kok-saghyz]
MDLPQDIDDYLRESIEYTLCLPVSTRTLELKLRSSEEAQRHIRDQCFYLKSKLLEKDKAIDGARAESSMNAQAVKKFIEENQKLAMECGNLVARCTKLEKECSLYDHDVEVLMEFGNEADERAKEAELRAHCLEEKLSKLSEELEAFKHQSQAQNGGEVTDSESSEEDLLVVTLLSTLINNDEVASTAHSFLEANSGVDVCQKILKTWDSSLKPSTRVVLALACEVKKLQKDKDNLRINLTKAEEEVIVLCNENDILDKENLRLTNLLQKEGQLLDSGGKQSSRSIKGHKRKSSSCPKEKKIDLNDATGSPRQPLSPLLHNT